MKTLTIICLSSLLTAVHAQNIYKTVDDQGNVSYSSSVGENTKNVEVLTPPPEPSAKDVEAARQQQKELEQNLKERINKREQAEQEQRSESDYRENSFVEEYDATDDVYSDLDPARRHARPRALPGDPGVRRENVPVRPADRPRPGPRP
jgi:hypothetical protein